MEHCPSEGQNKCSPSQEMLLKFMEIEGSLPCSRQPGLGPSSEPNMVESYVYRTVHHCDS